MWALFAVALAQTEPPAPRDRARTNEVRVRLDEWFDEARADGVTEASHPVGADVRHPNGRMTYDGACHWRRRDRQRPVFAGDEQEDQEEREPAKPWPLPQTVSPFRSASAGAMMRFPATFSVPALSFESPADGVIVEFDSIDAALMPGAFLSTTLVFGDFEIVVFGGYLSGRFEADSGGGGASVSEGRGGGGGGGTADDFRLSGTLSFLEFGAAPILKRFEFGVFAIELAAEAGIAWGRLTGMEVERSGSASETLAADDENVFAFFAGPLVRASARLGSAIRVGTTGEFRRQFGQAEGWAGSAGIELRVDF
ncbi:MAG: hypothetical protein HYY17_04230 [Planctomycetes bacterium]|nr:hypothetical protein [Planctomycetota bacterium]